MAAGSSMPSCFACAKYVRDKQREMQVNGNTYLGENERAAQDFVNGGSHGHVMLKTLIDDLGKFL
jgi:hypothetical protein